MSPRITIKRLGGGDENNSSDEQEWLDHVTEVFAFKGTPREYFQRHYYFDPYRHHPPAALLGLFADGILASSVRIYARKMKRTVRMAPMQNPRQKTVTKNAATSKEEKSRRRVSTVESSRRSRSRCWW